MIPNKKENFEYILLDVTARFKFFGGQVKWTNSFRFVANTEDRLFCLAGGVIRIKREKEGENYSSGRRAHAPLPWAWGLRCTFFHIAHPQIKSMGAFDSSRGEKEEKHDVQVTCKGNGGRERKTIRFFSVSFFLPLCASWHSSFTLPTSFHLSSHSLSCSSQNNHHPPSSFFPESQKNKCFLSEVFFASQGVELRIETFPDSPFPSPLKQSMFPE